MIKSWGTLTKNANYNKNFQYFVTPHRNGWLSDGHTKTISWALLLSCALNDLVRARWLLAFGLYLKFLHAVPFLQLGLLIIFFLLQKVILRHKNTLLFKEKILLWSLSASNFYFCHRSLSFKQLIQLWKLSTNWLVIHTNN